MGNPFGVWIVWAYLVTQDRWCSHIILGTATLLIGLYYLALVSYFSPPRERNRRVDGQEKDRQEGCPPENHQASQEKGQKTTCRAIRTRRGPPTQQSAGGSGHPPHRSDPPREADLRVRSPSQSATRVGGEGRTAGFEVPTVSLARPRTDRSPQPIIEAVHQLATARAVHRPGHPAKQLASSRTPKRNPPLRDAIDFYKHQNGWSNRLVAAIRCW